GKQAGQSINDGITKGAKGAGKSVGDAIIEGATRGGEEAGKAAGEALNKGVTEGAKKTKVTLPKVDTKPAQDSIIRDIGGSILEAARQGAKDAGTTLEAEFGKAAAKAGRAIGNAIGDSPLGDWVRNLGVDGDQVISVMEGIGKSITGVKNQDIGGTLTGISVALNGIGQSDAANVFEKIGTVAGNAQQSFRDIKGDIEDTATGLGLLATNSPKAAKGLESIGAAAGPIGLTVTAAKELDDALTQLGVAKYAEVPGSALWFMHELSNGFSGVKDFLGATPFAGPDPTKGFQSPIQSKPGVSVIPLPGSAPAVEDGYTAVTGSMDPFAALAPQGKPGAAPSGNSGGAPAVPLVQTASGAWTSTNPAWAHLIGRESSGINQRQGIIDANSGGNEAEGLFQITPRTWAAHGGTSFAPSAIAATPQQQAQIAARILQSNPSGSDWGAGLPGRENAAALLQGLVPTGFDDGGPLPPGLQLVNNASGKPEIVLTQDQAKNALQGIPGAGAGPSDTPLSSGMSPGPNGAAALSSVLGGQSPDAPAGLGLTGAPAGQDLRTQGYIPAGAGGGGQAGTSLWSGAMQMGAQAVNGIIDQAASAAATAISAAATAGSFGAGGEAAGPAAAFAIGIGANMAKRGVQYGFQLAGIGGDALTEILMPFGVPRFFQTDPSQFMPQLPNMAAAVTTGEKAQGQQEGLQTPSPSGPVQPGQMPGQQVVGAPAPIAQPGTGNFTPAPAAAPALSGAQPQGVSPTLAPTAPMGPQAPKSGPMAQPNQPPAAPIPQKPPGPLDFVPLDVGSFDTGGWLMPNGIAINQTNRPEPILNPQQFDDLHAIASRGMPELDPKVASGYAPDYSVRIENVTVSDVEAMRREIDSRQRLQMMRFAGRP
ncbi:transglycosylase family protein, partial [Mycobacterium intracellulare]|uniref:transglycosylase family protein n=1 Tax=Mycobacterium intracellulare TaxID=1767 RepID=UPI000CE51234